LAICQKRWGVVGCRGKGGKRIQKGAGFERGAKLGAPCGRAKRKFNLGQARSKKRSALIRNKTSYQNVWGGVAKSKKRSVSNKTEPQEGNIRNKRQEKTKKTGKNRTRKKKSWRTPLGGSTATALFRGGKGLSPRTDKGDKKGGHVWQGQ